MTDRELEAKAVNVIRGLAIDAVQKANSGHPGTPMALAPLAHVLFTRIMHYDAAAPDWFDRDRFVLSNGHASMLLYALLFLCGVGGDDALSLADIEQFRQWGSRTAGHPEHGHAPGIEVTTGPLGQGFANAVGMAIAEHSLRARFGESVCDHHVFVVAGDGCFEEGVSHEAASLAGHLGLGRLVCVYDDNHITIDGPTSLAYSDDVPGRFAAYGWHVVQLGEAAEDLDAIEQGIRTAMAEEHKPSVVVLRSHIGYPSPKYQDTAKAHGEPLGAEEVAVVKEILGLPPTEFFVPDDVLAFYRAAGARGADRRAAWNARRAAFAETHATAAEEFTACLEGRGLEGWDAKLPEYAAGDAVATRAASADVVSAIVDVVPGLLGGGADLTGNTGTLVKGARAVERDDFTARQLHYGVREHGMGAVMVGMALHGGVLPFGGTFFVFSDYMRPAVRLAALSGAHVAFVWSHDSVGLGEDGPTHQPIEHLMSLRAMPGLRLIRPADANETVEAWRIHLDSTGPTGIVLSRQKLPVLEGTAEKAPAGVRRGAYVLVTEGAEEPDLVLIGTGSEVSVCVEARARLLEEGIAARVVSMPSWDLFEAQPESYQDDVLPDGVPALAVEAGATLGWERWADDAVGIDRFGASAPGATVLHELGISVDNVIEQALELLDDEEDG